MKNEVYYHLSLKQLYDKINKDHAMDNRFEWSEDTRAGYKKHYEKLGDHLNDRPFLEYDLDEFEAALTAI